MLPNNLMLKIITFYRISNVNKNIIDYEYKISSFVTSFKRDFVACAVKSNLSPFGGSYFCATRPAEFGHG